MTRHRLSFLLHQERSGRVTLTARRTFVVTALTIGIPAEVIMRWTGHSDWKSLQPYVAIVEDLKRSEMEKFDNL